jgi:hypothetical protein
MASQHMAQQGIIKFWISEKQCIASQNIAAHGTTRQGTASQSTAKHGQVGVNERTKTLHRITW